MTVDEYSEFLSHGVNRKIVSADFYKFDIKHYFSNFMKLDRTIRINRGGVTTKSNKITTNFRDVNMLSYYTCSSKSC